jgi:hypothetical protein
MPFLASSTQSLFTAYGYTTRFLETLLVTNPGVTTFALGINGAAIASGNWGANYQDVQRYQIINELQNRAAAHKQNGTAFVNQIYDNAASIGSVAPVAVPAGEGSGVYPNATPYGGPNPVEDIGQVA